MAGVNKQIDLLPADPFTRMTQNLIRSSHGHSTPNLKISCKSVQPFSCNVADKETKKKQITQKQYPVPLPGVGQKFQKWKGISSPIAQQLCLCWSPEYAKYVNFWQHLQAAFASWPATNSQSMESKNST